MEAVNRYLDHAVLKPGMTREEAIAAIQLGVEHDVFSVCVRPADIELALDLCKETTTAVGTVLSFPHGVVSPQGKSLEARTYIAQGVREIDMVANYGWIRSNLWSEVQADIEAVSNETCSQKIVLKVILETSELTSEQIRRATQIAADAGADFVKTSTGFSSGGATDEAVQTMLDASEGRIQVKASGGVRDRVRAMHLLEMGCRRLGVGYSSTPVICDALQPQKTISEAY